MERHFRYGDSLATKLRNFLWWAFFLDRLEVKDEVDQVLATMQLFGGELEFAGLPYFSRSWTFQEALLPGSRAVFVLDGRARKHDPRHTKRMFLTFKIYESMKHFAVRLSEKNSHTEIEKAIVKGTRGKEAFRRQEILKARQLQFNMGTYTDGGYLFCIPL